VSSIQTDASGRRFKVESNAWVPVDEEPAPAGVARRTSWSARELLATDFPEPRFAVPNLVPEGLTFFAGAPKLGKSWLALGLGIAVASGGRALGQIKVDAGKTLYLALEDSPRRLRDRLGILLNGDEGPEGLHFETEWARLGDGGAENLADWLIANPDARLVVIDVFTRIRPRELKRTDFYQADYEASAALQAVATEYGIAIMCIYHTRKAEASDFVETVQGTFGLAAGADTILVARRGRGQADAVLHVTGRDIPDQELALRFSPEARTWSLMGDAAEYNIGETRREVLETVRTHGSLTPKQLSDLTEIPYENAKKTMQRMANDGQLDAKSGTYALRTPVPGVPVSPEESASGTKGQGGHRNYRESVPAGEDWG
jgi:hypothetical protein